MDIVRLGSGRMKHDDRWFCFPLVKGKIDIYVIGWASKVASKTDLKVEHGGHDS